MSWIKLDRKILEWRWWNDTNTLSVWIHILLSANWQEKEWKKMVIPRGSFVTTTEYIAEECGLTEKQVRRVLNNLESTGEIVRSRAMKCTMITICKYDTYQGEEMTKGQRKGNERATKGQRKGNIKRNGRSKEINNISLCPAPARVSPERDEGLTPRERELIFTNLFFKFGTRAAEELERFIDHYETQGWRKSGGVKITDRVTLSKSWTSSSTEKGDIPESFLKCLRAAYHRIGDDASPLTRILKVKATDTELHILARESDRVFEYIDSHSDIIGPCIRKSFNQKIIYHCQKDGPKNG